MLFFDTIYSLGFCFCFRLANICFDVFFLILFRSPCVMARSIFSCSFYFSFFVVFRFLNSIFIIPSACSLFLFIFYFFNSVYLSCGLWLWHFPVLVNSSSPMLSSIPRTGLEVAFTPHATSGPTAATAAAAGSGRSRCCWGVCIFSSRGRVRGISAATVGHYTGTKWRSARPQPSTIH